MASDTHVAHRPLSGWQMAQFFNSSKIRFRELKGFLLQHAERVKQHAIDVAKQEGRPFQYLQEKVRKEELAKEIAARDQIQDGLICVFFSTGALPHVFIPV